ncbi:MAG TPA: AbrB/MazE/SpoVT family DNA-binding domain-containing protein [Bacillota bacterium]
MRLPVVKIGGAHGVRLPQTVLKQCGIGDRVEIELDGDSLILRPYSGEEPSHSNVIYVKFN